MATLPRYSLPNSRWLSITFDDGFRRGSEVASSILREHGLTATFYVVTGWVSPVRTLIREKYNAGIDHGDWDHWRRIRDEGHEVGSHTFSHLNMTGKMAKLFPWLVYEELRRSRDDLAREVVQPLYTISMAWNAASVRSERIVQKHYAACRLGSSKLEYNSLHSLTPFRLASWAPDGSTTQADLEAAISGIPDGGWLILQYHSIDDEGWEPITRDQFEALCSFASKQKTIGVGSVAQVIAEFSGMANTRGP